MTPTGASAAVVLLFLPLVSPSAVVAVAMPRSSWEGGKTLRAVVQPLLLVVAVTETAAAAIPVSTIGV